MTPEHFTELIDTIKMTKKMTYEELGDMFNVKGAQIMYWKEHGVPYAASIIIRHTLRDKFNRADEFKRARKVRQFQRKPKVIVKKVRKKLPAIYFEELVERYCMTNGVDLQDVAIMLNVDKETVRRWTKIGVPNFRRSLIEKNLITYSKEA